MRGKPENLAPPFPKGVSGNPGGRTKADLEIEAFARLHAKAAIQVLVTEMQTAESSRDRMQAAEKVLERAYGKPKEHQTIAYERPITELSNAELQAIIESAGSEGAVGTKAGAAKPH